MGLHRRLADAQGGSDLRVGQATADLDQDAPLVVGGLAAARGFPLATVLVLWFSAGINMLVVDWIRYREDVAYHAALSLVMSLLGAAGFGLVRLVSWARSSHGVDKQATSATVN